MEAVDLNRNIKQFLLLGICTVTYVGVRAVTYFNKNEGEDKLADLAKYLIGAMGFWSALGVWLCWQPNLNPPDQIEDLVRADGVDDPDLIDRLVVVIANARF